MIRSLCNHILPSLFRCLNQFDRALLAVSAEPGETNDTVSLGIQRIITAASDIGAGMDVGSALSVQDVAGLYKLSVRSLRSQSLRLRITAVLCGTDALLMREKLKIHIEHGLYLLKS